MLVVESESELHNRARLEIHSAFGEQSQTLDLFGHPKARRPSTEEASAPKPRLGVVDGPGGERGAIQFLNQVVSKIKVVMTDWHLYEAMIDVTSRKWKCMIPVHVAVVFSHVHSNCTVTT